MRFLIHLLLSSSLFGWEHAAWLEFVKNRSDQEAVSWLQGKLQAEKDLSIVENLSSLLGNQCKNCFKGELFEINDPTLYVFMSFSVPDQIWISLSKQMDDSAVFVIRGLPNNSFCQLAEKLVHLKEKGMDAPVQIYPQLFSKFSIQRVPAFVFCENNQSEKMEGAVSVDFAKKYVRNHE